MELVLSPWEKTFASFGQSIRTEAILVAPYIGAAPLVRLSELLNRENPPQIDLVTNFDVNSLLHGTVAVEAIANFSKQLQTVTVRHLPSLHAKVYVADEAFAIITSGNLTQAALRTNHEFGVQFTEPEFVRQIADCMRKYCSQGTEVSIGELEVLAEKSRYLRTKYRDLIEGVTHSAGKDFQEALLATKDVLPVWAEVPGDSETPVFARAILEILKDGPLSTRDIHPIIEGLHPYLCDNSVYQVHNGTRLGRRWKHLVRSAQRHLKRRGLIVNSEGKWYLS